jgi:hypothetical protein
MDDAVLRCRDVLGNYLIELIGETVEPHGTHIWRIAAKEIIKHDSTLYYPKDCQDLMMAAVELTDLNCRLADPLNCFSEELSGEPEPYSADGILFPAWVHIVRIEDNLFAWGWLPEQLRALGLAIDPGDAVAWPITRGFVTIKDREGNCRRFYRLSS